MSPRKKRGGRDKRHIPTIVIGLLVIFVSVAITYAAFHKRVPFTTRWTLVGDFANSNQIRNGSPVRIAGIEVGQVISVKSGPNATALVSMAISKSGLPIHADARLLIRERLFLEGSYYVQLEPGSPSSPVVKSGYTVPTANTSDGVSLFNILGTFTYPTREQAANFLKGFAEGLGGGGAAGLNATFSVLGQTFENTAIATNALQGTQPNDLRHIVEGLSGISQTLAADDAQLGPEIDNLDRFSGALATQSNNLAATVDGFDQVERAAPAALTSINAALPSVQRLGTQLYPALIEAPPILNGTTAVLSELSALSESTKLPAFLTSLSSISRAFPMLATEVELLFNKVQPLTSCFNTQLLPAADTELDDGDLSTQQPIWEDFLHAFTGLASGAQNFNANGDYARVNGGIGEGTTGPAGATGATGDAATDVYTGSITGERPAWNGVNGAPALRPDVSCTTQTQPDLQTAATSAGENGTTP